MTDLIKTTTDNDDASITVELDTLIEEVRLCIDKCRLYSKIPGIGKLERKFRAEDRFLQRVSIRIFLLTMKTIENSSSLKKKTMFFEFLWMIRVAKDKRKKCSLSF